MLINHAYLITNRNVNFTWCMVVWLPTSTRKLGSSFLAKLLCRYSITSILFLSPLSIKSTNIMHYTSQR